jgi:hypothetical protein
MLLPLLIWQNTSSKLRMKGLSFLWLISTNSLNIYNKLHRSSITGTLHLEQQQTKLLYICFKQSHNHDISLLFGNHYSCELLLCIKILHCKIVSKYFIRIKLDCATSDVLQTSHPVLISLDKIIILMLPIYNIKNAY